MTVLRTLLIFFYIFLQSIIYQTKERLAFEARS